MVTNLPDSRRIDVPPALAVGGIAALVIVALVALVGWIIGLFGSEEPASAAPDASDLTAGTCAAGLPQPTWVPDVVTGVAVECPEAISARIGYLASTDHIGTWVVYSLSGDANAEALPGSAPETWNRADTDSGAIHPAASIMFVAYPGADEISEELHGANVTVDSVDLEDGPSARLTRVDNNGYGPVRLEWTDDDGSYLLLTVVGRTPAGRAGPTVDELIRMASSVAPQG